MSPNSAAALQQILVDTPLQNLLPHKLKLQSVPHHLPFPFPFPSLPSPSPLLQTLPTYLPTYPSHIQTYLHSPPLKGRLISTTVKNPPESSYIVSRTFFLPSAVADRSRAYRSSRLHIFVTDAPRPGEKKIILF